ncbi:hypothetical protein RFI_28780 [Reticulomyxa filosa]|uniref:Uncharacterized protein n=1 Tax=Reticulomyxa filosa TaxID=46433 RepID=X6M4M9_RETFI|nr:hypothetical protein RFI_28780 [Reticulomyxa filosa]|eukprot:ETO08606.1 hypothetical protein RFI_28780 [Reticulomyxa filosa]
MKNKNCVTAYSHLTTTWSPNPTESIIQQLCINFTLDFMSVNDWWASDIVSAVVLSYQDTLKIEANYVEAKVENLNTKTTGPANRTITNYYGDIASQIGCRSANECNSLEARFSNQSASFEASLVIYLQAQNLTLSSFYMQIANVTNDSDDEKHTIIIIKGGGGEGEISPFFFLTNPSQNKTCAAVVACCSIVGIICWKKVNAFRRRKRYADPDDVPMEFLLDSNPDVDEEQGFKQRGKNKTNAGSHGDDMQASLADDEEIMDPDPQMHHQEGNTRRFSISTSGDYQHFKSRGGDHDDERNRYLDVDTYLDSRDIAPMESATIRIPHDNDSDDGEFMLNQTLRYMWHTLKEGIKHIIYASYITHMYMHICLYTHM